MVKRIMVFKHLIPCRGQTVEGWASCFAGDDIYGWHTNNKHLFNRSPLSQLE
jgi:hypothetical protein